MPKYAANTAVSSELSRNEIERTLIRYGANQFAYASSTGQAMIAFVMAGRQIRFMLPLPAKEEFRKTPTGRERTPTSQQTEWEQACRQRWRALNLVIKAKLEAVDAGISIMEQEFMANIVLPGGRTVSDMVLPEIERAYVTGHVPSLMLEAGGNR